MTPLKYTLVPTLASLRWQMNDIGGPWILRGNWDFTFTGGFTWIPRGPETHYLAHDMGIRRNFVRPKSCRSLTYAWAPGELTPRAPWGCSLCRYNFNSRYAISAGINFMHVSNMYLSEPRFLNYGISVYGPMFGLDVRLGKPKRASAR